MKLSKLSLACVLAATGLSVSGTADAYSHETFEFNGYFRQGVLLSAENDFKQSNFAGQKETLGRLGLEVDNQSNLDFASVWKFDDGRKLRIGAGVSQGLTAMGTTGFVEFDGVTETGKFFAGRRDYGKERYIFMTDFFYTDMSGTLIGIEQLEVGDVNMNMAYVASYRDDVEGDRWDGQNLNNIMHTINVAGKYLDWDISANAKLMIDNWDVNGKEWAESGFDLTATYSLDSFFGLRGKGGSFANIAAQAGIGLGSGNLLGGTITSYNAYSPGSLRQGEHAFEWGPDYDAKSLLTQVENDDTSARMLIWGGHTFSNGLGIFPSIQGQYNDHSTGGYDYWVSAMVRPVYGINGHFYLQGEIGYVHNNWSGGTWDQSKITFAPTFMLPTGTAVNPEVRLLATYLPESWTTDETKGQSKGDFILGFQADVFW